MAETAAILSPEKTVLLPDLDAGCSLADSITADELREWKSLNPGAVVVMYVNTTAEVKAETDYCCTSSNAVQVVEHIWREHGEDTEILFGPDMFLGAYVEKVTGRRMKVWTGSAMCTQASGPRTSPRCARRTRAPIPDPSRVRLLDSVMEYVAAGDVDAENTHMLSTGGMLARPGVRRRHVHRRHRDRHAAPARAGKPRQNFVPANEAAVCQFMKMITLPKLRDCLRDLSPVVTVDPAIAERARVPIERMVSITPLALLALGLERPAVCAGAAEQLLGRRLPLEEAVDHVSLDLGALLVDGSGHPVGRAVGELFLA